MRPFLNTDLQHYGKIQKRNWSIFLLTVIYFCYWKGNLSSVGRNEVWQREEITQGVFSGGLFLMRSVYLSQSLEQILEKGYIKGDKIRKEKIKNEIELKSHIEISI